MTFPATKRLWGFLWRVPVGWEDTGIEVEEHKLFCGAELTRLLGIGNGYCACGTRARFGFEKEGNEVVSMFKFCGKCFTKLTDTK